MVSQLDAKNVREPHRSVVARVEEVDRYNLGSRRRECMREYTRLRREQLYQLL